MIGPAAVKVLDLEAIEVALRRRALAIAAKALERQLNADTSDHAGPSLPCPHCGQSARFAGRLLKSFQSVLGELTLERAYYHCSSCRTGFCPRDQALGLADTALSPGVTRMTGLTAAMVSFAESSELLRELAGVPVDAKQVERTAEALGREIARDEQEVVEPATEAEIAPTMYLGVDGTGIPVRKEELEGRKGKQPDGSAKTREVKLCAVWSAESRDEEGQAVRDAGSVSYSAAIESAAQRDVDEAPAEFWQRVEREARRRGYDRAARQAALGDGALWIWNGVGEHLPNAIQIVDRAHAKEHLSNVAKAIFGPHSDLGQQWAKQHKDELEEGDVEAVLSALAAHADSNEEARKNYDYFDRNRERMRYADFHRQGLCTTTAVLESGCKTAIGARLKRGGMHWTVAGADAIIALRCCKLSGRFEDFWERRAAYHTASG